MDLSLNSYAIMQKGNGNKLKKVVFYVADVPKIFENAFLIP